MLASSTSLSELSKTSMNPAVWRAGCQCGHRPRSVWHSWKNLCVTLGCTQEVILGRIRALRVKMDENSVYLVLVP